MAPVEGPISGTLYFSRTGIAASFVGVPRERNKANTFFSSISFRMTSGVLFGSNPSSMDSSTILRPCTPPLAFTASKYARAPAVSSLTVPATDPVKPAACPMRILSAVTPTWARAAQAHKNAAAAAEHLIRHLRIDMGWLPVQESSVEAAIVERHSAPAGVRLRTGPSDL